MTPSFKTAAGAVGLLLGLGSVYAATSLETATYSPDVTTSLGGNAVMDENVVDDDLAGGTAPVDLGVIPVGTDLDAVHEFLNGDLLFSVDSAVELSGGLTVQRADVVRYDGIDYFLEFDASAEGIPDRADVDAVTVLDGQLLLSFDVTLSLDGHTFDDEDLVLFDDGAFSVFFDGSSAGVEPELDLDAAHHIECNGHFLYSFDGSGSVDGVDFDDEDILEYDPDGGTWELAYDGSAQHPSWGRADLDALHATPDPGPGPPVVFGQTLLALNKTDFEWANPVQWAGVRGEFVTSTDVGDYNINAQGAGNGMGFSDIEFPASGSGFWYLLSPGGCEASSWQTMLGDEPARDAALP